MLKRRFYALLYSFKDTLFGDVSIYASALTLSFLMVLGSFLMFLGFLAGYIPFVSQEKVIHSVGQIFPKYVEGFISKIFNVYKHKKVDLTFSLFISYVFLVNYSRLLAKSISYLLKEDIKLKELLFWMFVPIYLLVFLLAIFLGSILIPLLKFLVPNKLSFLLDFLKFLVFFPIIWLTYWFFLRKTLKPLRILEASLFFFTSLTLINFVFVKFLFKLISLQPLYTALGSLLSFLLWLQLVFSFLLGAVLYAKRLDC